MAHGLALLRSRVHQLFVSESQLTAAEERARALRLGSTPIGETKDRQRVRASGVIRAVTLRPRQSVPVYEVELYDGTGALAVRWLGRRNVVGVEPGRRMIVTGLVRIMPGGLRLMCNPRYELVPRAGE